MASRQFLQPPLPLYRLLAALVFPVICCCWLTGWFYSLNPLQRIYLPDYAKVSMVPLREVSGQVLVDGSGSPVLSVAGLGASGIRKESMSVKRDGYRDWLKTYVFGGRGWWELLSASCWTLMALGILLLVGSSLADWKRHAEFRGKPRKIEGPDLLTPKAFNSQVKGDGLGFYVKTGWWIFKHKEFVQIRREVESQHILTMAEQGAGKSTMIKNVVDGLLSERGWVGVFYDPHLEYIERYWKPGDVIMGIDQRGAPWDPCEEINWRTESEAQTSLAAMMESLYPGDLRAHDGFFVGGARTIVKHLIYNYRPTASKLAQFMTQTKLIDAISAGTELNEMLKENADGQRAGLMATMTANVLDMLRQIKEPTEEHPGWSAESWVKHRSCNIFFTSTLETRASSAPLQRLWIDMLIRKMLSMGKRPDLPKVVMVLDELPALGELSQLPVLMKESRKTEAVTVILGFQSKSDIEKIYGKPGDGIISAPYSKFLLRCGEAVAQEWMSKELGSVKLEKFRESRGHRKWLIFPPERTFTTDTVTEPLVLPSQFSGLKPLHGYFLYENKVVKCELALAPHVKPRTAGYIPPDGESPKILPMPDLATIEAKDEANRLAKSSAVEAALINPPPVAPRPTVPGVQGTAQAAKKYPARMKIAERDKRRKFLAILDEFVKNSSGPNVFSYFACESCEQVDGFLGEIDEPATGCQSCGGEFAKTETTGFIRVLGKG